MLCNELNLGRPIWNRLRQVNEPSSDKQIQRQNVASKWIITEVPELRLCFGALWTKVKARREGLDSTPAAKENEIRVGLGHYERARIAARAVEQGVYPGLKAALNHLYQNVSRAKRSKIGSFVSVYQVLDGSLRLPAALPERLGLALAQALEADVSLADRVKAALATTVPATAAEEQAHLARLLRPVAPSGMAEAPARPTDAVEPAPGIWLQVANSPQGARYTLSGPGADAAFGARLADWLGTQR
jgi:hypothetical protein